MHRHIQPFVTPGGIALRQWLIDYIASAFRGVTLGPGTTIYEGENRSNYGFTPEELRHVKSAERVDWGRVPVDDLYARSAGLLFLDADGHRFYTPAIMTAILRYGTRDGALCHTFIFDLGYLPKHSCMVGTAQFRMVYNRSQRAAIVRFLKFAIHCAPADFPLNDALRALDAVQLCSCVAEAK